MNNNQIDDDSLGFITELQRGNDEREERIRFFYKLNKFFNNLLPNYDNEENRKHEPKLILAIKELWTRLLEMKPKTISTSLSALEELAVIYYEDEDEDEGEPSVHRITDSRPKSKFPIYQTTDSCYTDELLSFIKILLQLIVAKSSDRNNLIEILKESYLNNQDLSIIVGKCGVILNKGLRMLLLHSDVLSIDDWMNNVWSIDTYKTLKTINKKFDLSKEQVLKILLSSSHELICEKNHLSKTLNLARIKGLSNHDLLLVFCNYVLKEVSTMIANSIIFSKQELDDFFYLFDDFFSLIENDFQITSDQALNMQHDSFNNEPFFYELLNRTVPAALLRKILTNDHINPWQKLLLIDKVINEFNKFLYYLVKKGADFSIPNSKGKLVHDVLHEKIKILNLI